MFLPISLRFNSSLLHRWGRTILPKIVLKWPGVTGTMGKLKSLHGSCLLFHKVPLRLPISVGPLLLWVSLERHENAVAFDVYELKEETSVIPILSRSTKATRSTEHQAPSSKRGCEGRPVFSWGSLWPLASLSTPLSHGQKQA